MTNTQTKYTEGQPVEIEVYNYKTNVSEWLPGVFNSYTSALDRDEPRINCTLEDGREITAAAPECVRPFLIDDFETLKIAVGKCGGFMPVTERLFYYALEVLPPIYLTNKTFQMGEAYSGQLYYTFGEKDGQYFGCLCNKNYSLNNF